jgi:hypothetical protein
MAMVSVQFFIFFCFFFSFEGKLERFPPRLFWQTPFGGVRYTILKAVGIDTSAVFAIVSVPEGQNPTGQPNGLEVNLG